MQKIGLTLIFFFCFNFSLHGMDHTSKKAQGLVTYSTHKLHRSPSLQALHHAIEKDDKKAVKQILQTYQPSKALPEVHNPLVLAVLLERESLTQTLVNAQFPVSMQIVQHALSLENQNLINIVVSARKQQLENEIH